MRTTLSGQAIQAATLATPSRETFVAAMSLSSQKKEGHLPWSMTKLFLMPALDVNELHSCCVILFFSVNDSGLG